MSKKELDPLQQDKIRQVCLKQILKRHFRKDVLRKLCAEKKQFQMQFNAG